MDTFERQDSTDPIGPWDRSTRLYVAVVFSSDRALHGTAIPLEPPVVVGREGALAIADPGTSREHLRFELTADGLRVRDLGSRNGTFVDGRPLPADRVAPLEDGALVRLGETLLLVRYGEVPDEPWDDAFMPGHAPAVRATRRLAAKLGPLGHPVALVGETGTGKEFAARALHAMHRPEGPFVAVNCGALSRGTSRAELFGVSRGAYTDAVAKAGLVAAAAGGTLFLDEIGDLDAAVQVELMRLVQEGTYRRVGDAPEQRSDARLLAATHVDLTAAVAAGRFRRDLHARLKMHAPPLRLPPLRERREDLPRWVARLLGGEAPTASAGFYEALAIHPLPDNLRELQSAVNGAVLAAEPGARLVATHLPDAVQQPRLDARAGTPRSLPAKGSDRPPPDAEALRAALEHTGGVVSRAAAHLGVGRRTLYRLCERHGIDPDSFRV